MDPRFFDSPSPMMIGGVKFRACMFTDRDYGELLHYTQAKFISLATISSSFIPDQDIRRELQMNAIHEASQFKWEDEYVQNLLWTREGVIHIGYQLIRKNHKGVSFEQFADTAGLYDEDSNTKLIESMKEIGNVYKKLHIPPEELNKGLQGGSSTESSKSSESSN